MAIDDFISGDAEGSSSNSGSGGSGSSSSSSSYTTVNRDRWQTKIDFGAAYVLVAQDRQKNIYVHHDSICVKESATSWKRLEDDFRRVCPECSYSTEDKDRLHNHIKTEHDLGDYDEEETLSNLEREYSHEYEILYRMSSRSGWLRFCNLCQEQLGVDPNEVLAEDPVRLRELEEKVYYPPKSKPDPNATCQVCGSSSSEPDADVVQMKLEKHKRLNVCADHTVEELAREGFMQ